MVKKGEISQKADTWRKAKAFGFGFGIITVDGWFRNPAAALVEFGSLFTIIYDGFYTSQVVIAGFLSSTLLRRAIICAGFSFFLPIFGWKVAIRVFLVWEHQGSVAWNKSLEFWISSWRSKWYSTCLGSGVSCSWNLRKISWGDDFFQRGS